MFKDLCPKIYLFGIFSQLNPFVCPYLHNTFAIWFWTFLAWYAHFHNPEPEIRIFVRVFRFLKKFILGTYMSWGVSGCKHFPDKMSGIPFLPLIGHFPAFVSMHHIYTTKMIIKYSFYAPDLELIWITFSLIVNSIAYSGLFKSNKSLKVLKKKLQKYESIWTIFHCFSLVCNTQHAHI